MKINYVSRETNTAKHNGYDLSRYDYNIITPFSCLVNINALSVFETIE